MPKVTLTPQKQLEERIVRNIRAIGNLNGCRYDKDIAKRTHIPVSTFCGKMNEPRKFTLADFSQIAQAFKVEPEKLFEGVQ